MNRKTMIMKKITSMLLTLMIALPGVFIAPVTAQAAGWLDTEIKNIVLGTAVSGTIKSGDYYGDIEERSVSLYWHVYKFTMPQEGLLNVYVESAAGGYEGYFGNNGNYDSEYTYAIFPALSPDHAVWCSGITDSYSSARGMYYGSTEVSLNMGEYYFAIRQPVTIDTPYYLTLSYKEPNVNVTSISLDKKSIKLEPDEQDALTATVLPDNATDKTIVWESSEPSTASIENGVVTAISPGTSTITAASADGEITASCLVTVIDTAAIDELEEAKPAITSLTAARKKVTVYFSSIGISDVKYQVAYKTGSGAWKIKNTANTSAIIRSLKSKKTYSIRVRGYKNIDGKVYYSGWSAAKQIKIK